MRGSTIPERKDVKSNNITNKIKQGTNKVVVDENQHGFEWYFSIHFLCVAGIRCYEILEVIEKYIPPVWA